MDFNTIKFEKKKIESWNNTLSSKAYILYPKNILELKKLISIIKKDKKKYLIRTGSCSYDSKSINPDLETIVISLKYFNKITKLDFKNKFIEVEAGALIEKIIKEIKKNHLTLFSVPGGDKISIGGAISANTIGKDSTPGISSFGDALISLEILSNDGKIKKISKNKYNLNKYVGAFGNEGIILKAKLKIKKIKSENVLLKTKILKNINEVRKEFNYKSSLFDFNVGYIGTVFLGIAFMSLGYFVMFGGGESFSSSAGSFSNQLIDMYTSSLGNWSYYIIGIAAFTTMLSTTITTLDASPRAMNRTTKLLINTNFKHGYLLWLAILAIGTIFIFFVFSSKMGLLVKIATILSFLTAPFYAIINYILISSKYTPKEYRPSMKLHILSILGIAFLVGFSVWFLLKGL